MTLDQLLEVALPQLKPGDINKVMHRAAHQLAELQQKVLKASAEEHLKEITVVKIQRIVTSYNFYEMGYSGRKLSYATIDASDAHPAPDSSDIVQVRRVDNLINQLNPNLLGVIKITFRLDYKYTLGDKPTEEQVNDFRWDLFTNNQCFNTIIEAYEKTSLYDLHAKPSVLHGHSKKERQTHMTVEFRQQMSSEEVLMLLSQEITAAQLGTQVKPPKERK